MDKIYDIKYINIYIIKESIYESICLNPITFSHKWIKPIMPQTCSYSTQICLILCRVDRIKGLDQLSTLCVDIQIHRKKQDIHWKDNNILPKND